MTQEEFEQLQSKCQPHPVLNKDFLQYYPLSFANAFLPKAGLFRSEGYEVYDGAELFNGRNDSKSLAISIEGKERLINFVWFTYPKGVAAEQKKTRVQPAEDEALSFFELRPDGSVDISFRFGTLFRTYLRAQGAAASREFETLRVSASDLKKHFQS